MTKHVPPRRLTKHPAHNPMIWKDVEKVFAKHDITDFNEVISLMAFIMIAMTAKHNSRGSCPQPSQYVTAINEAAHQITKFFPDFVRGQHWYRDKTLSLWS